MEAGLLKNPRRPPRPGAGVSREHARKYGLDGELDRLVHYAQKVLKARRLKGLTEEELASLTMEVENVRKRLQWLA